MTSAVAEPHAPEPSGDLADDAVVALYRRMVALRRIDVRLAAMRKEGRVPEHAPCRGEEAAIVGAAAAMRADDWIFGARLLGAALWRGVPIAAYVHHLFANARDVSKGRALGDRFGARAARIVAPGIEGPHLAHAVGFAWGAKTRGEDTAALASFRSARAADFHTALNFAGVFGAPVVFFAQSEDGAIAKKGVAYGIDGVTVDGSDVVAVVHAVRAARAAMRPIIVDAVVTNDDAVGRARRTLEARAAWTVADESDLVAAIDAEIESAVAEAETTPPPKDALFDDVFAATPWSLHEQRNRATRETR